MNFFINIIYSTFQAIPKRLFDSQRVFMWISSVASMLVWQVLQKEMGTANQLKPSFCIMFELTDEPTNSIFLRKYAMPPALRIHYHTASLETPTKAMLENLMASNQVPLFANNGIDWWLGQRTSSGKKYAENAGLIAAQVSIIV